MRDTITMIHQTDDGIKTEITRAYGPHLDYDIEELKDTFKMFLIAQGYSMDAISQVINIDEAKQGLESRVYELEHTLKEAIERLDYAFNTFA